MSAERETSTWTKRGLLKAALIACVAALAGAALGYKVAHVPPPPDATASAGPPRPKPAGPAERALLAPLAEGAALGELEVREIQAVNHEGVLRVICAKGRAVVRLDVALLADEGPEPPGATDRYAVFYSLKNATPEEGERLARALADVIKKNEAAAPVPPGMVPFVPGKREMPPI